MKQDYLRDLLIYETDYIVQKIIIEDEGYPCPTVFPMEELNKVFANETIFVIQAISRGSDYTGGDFNTNDEYFYLVDNDELHSIKHIYLADFYEQELAWYLPTDLKTIVRIFEEHQYRIDSNIYMEFEEWMEKNAPKDWGY